MVAALEPGSALDLGCGEGELLEWLSANRSVEGRGIEIDGRKGYPASCTTPVEAGMVVRTHSTQLAEVRRGVMELYISDHPLDCLTCSANNDCELQDTAAEVGLRDVRYGYAGASHLGAPTDGSNPYFDFDPSKCIVCSRCVRACDEVQGTLALTIDGRGFASVVSAGQAGDDFLSSECVSCGACVAACPTATLQEKAVKDIGKPERAVVTTCAYCGVGCTFRAEMRGEQLVRMVPWKDGKANRGHSCVKGRFAWGYATHPDRITTPMIRASIDEPWQKVSWETALNHAASEFRRIQAKHGRNAVGGITSSRCTNEETYLVQKLVRAAFGNNNVDTCARVCHSPTGYGLKQTLGESAGTQTFDSVLQADVVMVIGANPTEGHPVFGSLLKRRLREGAKLIVIDPRSIELVKTPHVQADYHLKLMPGTNVAVANALAHVIVTEGLVDSAYVAARCEDAAFQQWCEFVARAENSPEATAAITGVAAAAHPQLALYQLAVREGSVAAAADRAPGGGLLLYLGGRAGRMPTERTQDPLTAAGAEALSGRVLEAGRATVGPTYTARVGSWCTYCAVRSSCPAQAEGRQVTG